MKKVFKSIGFIIILIFLSALILSAVSDSDQDGVPDELDECPGSQTTFVDAKGCSCDQKLGSACLDLYGESNCCEPDQIPVNRGNLNISERHTIRENDA